MEAVDEDDDDGEERGEDRRRPAVQHFFVTQASV